MPSIPEDFRLARIAARAYTNVVLRYPNAFGCAVGRRISGGREAAEFGLTVFVTRKLPASMLRAEDLIPRELFVSDGAIRTDVVETPETRLARRLEA